MTPFVSTTRILGLAFVVTLPACAGRDEAPRQDASNAAPSIVELSIANNTVQAPDSIDAGWTTFHFANNGDDIHYAHIVRLDSARTPAELVAAYADAIRRSAARPAWVKRFGGPGGMAPGDTAVVTQHLEPGSYVWICPVEDNEGNPHFGKGEYKPFVIREAATASKGTAPTATATIQLVDFGFGLDAPLTAGRHTIRVENAGTEPHDVGLLKLAPGRTLEEVRAFLNPERARRPDQADNQPPPFDALGGVAGGIAAMAPGMEGFFEADLTPGDYVLACMVTAPDGRSHIEHGMIQHVRIQ